MRLLLTLSVCLLTLPAKAENLRPHVHGVVDLDIAAENNQILIMLKSPADSFLGFEYKAKTKKEKALVQSVRKTWKTELLNILGIKKDSGCKVSSSDWKQEFQGETHSEIIAESIVECPKSVASKTLSISLIKKYPKIETIHLQLISHDGKTTSKKMKDDIFKINL